MFQVEHYYTRICVTNLFQIFLLIQFFFYKNLFFYQNLGFLVKIMWDFNVLRSKFVKILVFQVLIIKLFS